MGIASGVIAGVGGIVKAVSGARQASQARQALRNYRRQELQNVYEGVGVATLGAQLQREEASRRFATGVEALQAGGVRGLVGGLGRLTQQNVIQERQIAADLEQQQRQIDIQRAQDQARIRALQEQREQQELAGLGQQLNVGRQDLFSGIGDIARTGFALTNLYGQQPQGRTPVQTVNQLNPVGYQQIGYTGAPQPDILGTPLGFANRLGISPFQTQGPQANLNFNIQ